MALSPNETFAPTRSGLLLIYPMLMQLLIKKNFRTTTKQRSFIDQQSSIAVPITNTNELKIVQSHIWRHSLYKNGYIMEILRIDGLTDYQHLGVIHSVYDSSNFHGIKFFLENLLKDIWSFILKMKF
ncbi:hypothetical protein BD770DRAFT_411098 [Pilaira anomala]|nr:hypothetical protein BD770DRAFT_411098 [Pilaira anomala]